eukprot:CAMPEP_0202059494 /NCGR_PEP_ID=MMETSP0963-20130614/35262_1 /ASSEMBLY_ACC=CAM_ASM_000494 /TAXON_ID=4773 /ORGANISM="Schizochytrium aggregatum, Strain ATCC28209" /LENGTH=117 /DNA_ID=CAMNT_0048625539 /DNA_START=47 /DNA_END=400 /DNA_ORIENTATION=-
MPWLETLPGGQSVQSTTSQRDLPHTPQTHSSGHLPARAALLLLGIAGAPLPQRDHLIVVHGEAAFCSSEQVTPPHHSTKLNVCDDGNQQKHATDNNQRDRVLLPPGGNVNPQVAGLE